MQQNPTDRLFVFGKKRGKNNDEENAATLFYMLETNLDLFERYKAKRDYL